MRSSKFTNEVHRRILRRADPKAKEGAERYFKHQVSFLGLTTPGLRALAREVDPLLADRPIKGQVAECFRLLHSPWAEEKQIGIVLLSRRVKHLPRGGFSGNSSRSSIAPSPTGLPVITLPEASCGPGSRCLGERCEAGELQSGDPADLRHPGQEPGSLRTTRHGWVLRELCLADAKSVLVLLRKNYGRISRGALRYAIEKMPPRLQSTLLLEHKPHATS